MGSGQLSMYCIILEEVGFSTDEYAVGQNFRFIPRVSTCLEKSGKSENFSKSGNCQGILKRVGELKKRVQNSGKFYFASGYKTTQIFFAIYVMLK